MAKELWTDKEAGEKVSLTIIFDSNTEAEYIVEKIIDESQNNQRNFSDFAILYRINAQSRSFEEELKNRGIAYVVVGGIRFYERKEIKDILSYIKIIINQNDRISLKRIINYPARNIGEATVAKLEKYSAANNISMFDSLGAADNFEEIPNNKKKILLDFYKLLKKYIELKESLNASELIKYLIEDLGIFTFLKQDGTPESLSKIENIRELISSIDEFLLNNPDKGLEHYLENVALITDVDNWDRLANAISLLTLHSAKGLEFPVVFIAGLEEGLFPLARQLADEADLEEERRLFYVGATRAKEKLYLTSAKYRRQYGEITIGSISRFVKELDKEYIDFIDLSKQSIHTNFIKVTIQRKTYSFSTFEEKKIALKGELKPGMLIRHDRFGKGVINTINGSGDEIKLDIFFEEVGLKKVFLKYCKLEILS